MTTKAKPIVPATLAPEEFKNTFLRKTNDYEKEVQRIYTDSKGIATIGKGTALVVKGSKGKYTFHEDYLERLRAVTGNPKLELSETERKLISDTIDHLNNGKIDKAQKLIPAYVEDDDPENNKFSFTTTDEGMNEVVLQDMKKAQGAVWQDVEAAAEEAGMSADEISAYKTEFETSTENDLDGKKDEDPLNDMQKIQRDLSVDDGELGNLQHKNGGDLTTEELKTVMNKRLELPPGAEKDRFHQLEKEYYDQTYGTEPVKNDATGRMIFVAKQKPTNTEPTPVLASSGQSLSDAITTLGKRLADNKSSRTSKELVQALQTGLNLSNQNRHQQTKAKSLFDQLKTDGAVGKKTRHAIRTVLTKAEHGAIDEGVALGQFKKIAERVQKGAIDTEGLRHATSSIFGPLYREPNTKPQKANHEGQCLQVTLNALMKGQPTSLKEDGDVGPLTTQAFNRSMKKINSHDFVSSLGNKLGFLNFLS